MLNGGVMMQVMAAGQLVMVVTGGQVQVVLVKVVRIGATVMDSRVVDIHQGVNGEAVIGCHLNGTRIVAVQQAVDWT